MSKNLLLWTVVCGLLALSVTLTSCEKPDIHENLIIEGNTPPPHEGISSLQLDHFANKLYIDLLGRGPTDEELESTVEQIKAGDYTPETRAAIAVELQNRYEYIKNYDALTRQRMLASLDSAVVENQISGFLVTAGNYEEDGDTTRANLFYWKAQNLEDLANAAVELLNGDIDVREYYFRNIFNPYYDQINMGSENFVLSVFENLLYREPTETELEEAVKMVDGFEGFVLLGDGNSKQDFVRLAVNSHPFCEGLVIEAFRAMHAREPSSYELGSYATTIFEGADWKENQLSIIKTTEYAGF